MQRRTFLTSSLMASALSVATPSVKLLAVEDTQKDAAKDTAQGTSKPKIREFYLLRHYILANGPQRKLCEDFFRDALVPALNRLGITPVGVFDSAIGAETPSFYVLMPSVSSEILVNLEAHLDQDAAYREAGAPFLNAPATAPAFVRLESSLMAAFEKIPKLTLPAATATHSPRVFELRTYESPSDQDHQRKVEMMQSGEEEIFANAGFSQVFYGEHLGARQKMGDLPVLPGMEEHVQPASLRIRKYRFEYHRCHSDAY